MKHIRRLFERSVIKMNKIDNVEIKELTNARFIKPKEVTFTQNGQQVIINLITYKNIFKI